MAEHLFPRTAHICKLAKVASDDVVAAAKDVECFLRRPILLEEKIDGANMGISVAHDGRLQVQRRGGGIVTLDKEPEHIKLRPWLERHQLELVDVLGRKYVLFGEWMEREHSMTYDRLSDWFLAFDVFDKEEQRFLSRAKRLALLRPTFISSVADFGAHQFNSTQELAAFVGTLTSHYVSNAEAPEGVVLRLEDDSWLLKRSKLVLPQFTQCIVPASFWTRMRSLRNIVPPALDLSCSASDGALRLDSASTEQAAQGAQKHLIGVADLRVSTRSGTWNVPANRGAETLQVRWKDDALVASGPALDRAVNVAVAAAVAAGRVNVLRADLARRHKRDGTSSYHIELASAAELRKHAAVQRQDQLVTVEKAQQALHGPGRVLGVGLEESAGRGSAAAWVVFARVMWPAAVAWRRSAGLSTASFTPHAVVAVPAKAGNGGLKDLDSLVWSCTDEGAATGSERRAIAALAIVQIAIATQHMSNQAEASKTDALSAAIASDLSFGEPLRVWSALTVDQPWADENQDANAADADALAWDELRVAMMLALLAACTNFPSLEAAQPAFAEAAWTLIDGLVPASSEARQEGNLAISSCLEQAMLHALKFYNGEWSPLPYWLHHASLALQYARSAQYCASRKQEWQDKADDAKDERVWTFAALPPRATYVPALDDTLARTLIECCLFSDQELTALCVSRQRHKQLSKEETLAETFDRGLNL